LIKQFPINQSIINALEIDEKAVASLQIRAAESARRNQSEALEAVDATMIVAINCARAANQVRKNLHQYPPAIYDNPEKVDPTDQANAEDTEAAKTFFENFEWISQNHSRHFLRNGYASISEEGGTRRHFLRNEVAEYIVGGDELDDSFGFDSGLYGGAGVWIYKRGEGILASCIAIPNLNLVLSRAYDGTTNLTFYPNSFFDSEPDYDLNLANGKPVF